MLSLAVDTSTLAGSLAVLREEQVLGVVGVSAGETYSSRLFRHLRFLLEELGLRLDRFDLFSVAAGPGSFTGLRVGLAAVKGWAEALRKPVAGVSVLEAVAAQATAPQSLLVPILDARRGQVFAGVYERENGALALRGDEIVLAPDEFLDSLVALVAGRPFALVTPTPEVIEPALRRSAFPSLPIERVSAVLAPPIGRLGYRRVLHGQALDPVDLDANYVRRSDAEIKWTD
jgi:tRNA threonylcarbamoyladenosine biosynthesis protein TsaB